MYPVFEMYPVLTVDGKDFKVVEIHYSTGGNIKGVGVFDNHNYVYYYDKSHEMYVEGKLKIDIKACLKWVNRYKEVNDKIENALEFKSQQLTELAIKSIEDDKPFTPNEYKEEYFKTQREMFGLMEAQEIIEDFIEGDE